MFLGGRQANLTFREIVVPEGWPIWRAFDWGASAPFSCGWWTISNGEFVRVRDDARSVLYFPAGSYLRVAELYGCHPDRSRKANVGLGWDADQVGKAIVQRERELFPGRSVIAGPGDAAMWATSGMKGGVTVADEICATGAVFTPSAKGPGSRVSGWQVMQRLLDASGRQTDKPGLYVCETCTDWFRTVPALPRDKTNRDDVDSAAEDHAADETRYFLTSPRFEVDVGHWRV